MHAGEALGAAMKDIQDVQAGVVSNDAVFTDFPSMDRMFHGLKPGELILIAARPSVGKTAFALNIAANVCLHHNKTVAIFSLEMPAQLLVKRMLANVSGCSLSSMDAVGGLSAAGTGKLYDAYRRLLAANLYIDDYSMNSPSDILSKCRRLKRDNGLDLVIIDYLQLMTAGGTGRSGESRQVEVSEMSRSMKIYAKELGVPILLLSQMSRGVEQRPDHTPKLSDLRESGAIEQDADVVMFLHKASQFNPAVPEDLVQLRKNRNGAIGDIDMQWDGETTTFRECVPGEQPAGHKEAPRPEYNRAAEKESDGEDADFADEEPETDKGLMRRPLIPIPTTPRTTRRTRAKATTRRKSLPTRNTRMSIPTRDTNATFPAGATMRRPATPRRRAESSRTTSSRTTSTTCSKRAARTATCRFDRTHKRNKPNQKGAFRALFHCLALPLALHFRSWSPPSFPPRNHAVFRNLTS